MTDFVPGKIVSALSFAAIVALALIPWRRTWFINQAVHHAQHELQLLIDQLITR